MSQQVKLTPDQALEVLKGVVQHPHLRFLNLSEMSTAVQSLEVLDAHFKPSNVVPLPKANRPE